MECHLGMADVQVAIRFRGESGHDLATSGFQVCLQLSCCVGNAHLAASGLRAESHHLVDLRTHIHIPFVGNYYSSYTTLNGPCQVSFCSASVNFVELC